MRRDLILPALLAVALAVMVVYATTWDGNDEAELLTSPLTCQDASIIGTLRQIPEASGLAASQGHPGVFWAHNDSAEPVVFAIGADGAIRGRVRVTGASVTDWEAVTTAPCESGSCLYVGDIGDNDRARASITIYRTSEPSPQDDATAPVVAIEGGYPEGPQDAEAMFLSQGVLYIVTKGEGMPIRVYRFPSLESGTRHTLQLVATLTESSADKSLRITDAALSPDNRWIALRSNDVLLFYDAKRLLSGQPDTARSYDVRGLNEPQGEGIAWADARTLFLAGEGEGGGTFARISCNLPA